MLMMVLCRFIGQTIGPASVAAIVQGHIKVLLHKRITGPDADEVCQKAKVRFYSTGCLTNMLTYYIAHSIHSHINT